MYSTYLGKGQGRGEGRVVGNCVLRIADGTNFDIIVPFLIQKVLLRPYQYLASRPGKEMRSQMIDAFNIWLKVPEEKIGVIHKVIGMLHTSSLL
jgi:hypothetical protein